MFTWRAICVVSLQQPASLVALLNLRLPAHRARWSSSAPADKQQHHTGSRAIPIARASNSMRTRSATTAQQDRPLDPPLHNHGTRQPAQPPALASTVRSKSTAHSAATTLALPRCQPKGGAHVAAVAVLAISVIQCSNVGAFRGMQLQSGRLARCDVSARHMQQPASSVLQAFTVLSIMVDLGSASLRSEAR
ncbi:hypothetical protein WJX73_010167 [Symbiochloris irregularis]|uniref:Uncharacterized protein n=1 Tax=Symbiochloris irregularis TaxID=706552 RepID=A0AAW1PZB6_9CHLO